MNRKFIVLLAICLTIGSLSYSFAANSTGGKKASEAPLAAAETQKVGEILSHYDKTSLTADKAKAIHKAFREAGIKGGPALNEAVRAAGFSPEKLRDLDPPPDRPGDAKKDEKKAEPEEREQGKGKSGGYSLDQAISDRAQLNTIAFSGLAFITGDFGADTFLPPGKVCDFFGFQYMRDIDAAGKGHNPMFLDRVAANVLLILTESQRRELEALAREQAHKFDELAMKRLPLIKAFRRELESNQSGSPSALNKAKVTGYVGEIFELDAKLAWERAKLFGRIATSLTTAQKTYLASMQFGDFATWPEVDMEKHKLPRGTEKSINVAYMTFASEFFSWYAGSAEADTYFCPERHGTYFGGFYMKDMPAMGKRDYDISTSVTGDSGENFIKTLNPEQQKSITALPGLQRNALAEIVKTRRAMAMELRKFLNGGQADSGKVLALGRRYGELDGELSYLYVEAFATINKTLTTSQRVALMKLRNLDGYKSAPAYLYSTPLSAMPDIKATDDFFVRQ